MKLCWCTVGGESRVEVLSLEVKITGKLKAAVSTIAKSKFMMEPELRAVVESNNNSNGGHSPFSVEP